MNPEKFNVLLKFFERLVEEEEYECKYCPEYFESAEQLKIHSITVHTDQRFVCDICWHEFKNEKSIKIHLTMKHNLKRPKRKNYKRKLCVEEDYEPEINTESDESSGYDEYDDKGIRRKRPGREYPSKCDHCDFVVLRRAEHFHHYLQVHQDIIDQYPFAAKRVPCTQCGVQYSEAKLDLHMKAVHSDKKEKEVKCTVCGKLCSTHLTMLAHRIRVHPKKILICDYCSKQFKTKQDLSRHIMFHLGLKPYKCHLCSASFTFYGNRTVHIRSAHTIDATSTKKSRKLKESEKSTGERKLTTNVKVKGRKVKGRGRPTKTIPVKKYSKSDSDDEKLIVIKKKKYT